MRNLFALIGFAVVTFAVVGWYCGWYQLSVSTNSSGQTEIKTVVHTQKVADDSTAFFQGLGKLIQDKMAKGTDKGTDPAAGPATKDAAKTPNGPSPANGTPVPPPPQRN